LFLVGDAKQSRSVDRGPLDPDCFASLATTSADADITRQARNANLSHFVEKVRAAGVVE